ncbi:TetR/AcrR family transcriptional regulator [Tessaracoccus defluvii]|uniref:TetR/AcrR family transcriptional regulator n=1 Tax=Tessaracoccus defluvii TaxID=1285901 RepID=A0A7H0H4H1_9ACTN|nr:TetR/AcrR family transcriptional regulator [Tessaracoccus defluvii]QNP55437.1 TetR/AcrR family transcriptional regulator [Tessaracoccus defluvii]
MPETSKDPNRLQKGRERRREIVAMAADLFAADGYRHASVRELAKRVGLSQAGVLHHFSAKEELLVEVLELRDASVAEHLSSAPASDVRSRSREVARHAEEHPGLTSLYIALSAEAITPDHPAHAHFVEHYRQAQVTTRPQRDATPGSDAGISDEMIATLGTAVMDGLLLQRRYRDDLDVVAAVDAFWGLVSAARAPSQPPAVTAGSDSGANPT